MPTGYPPFITSMMLSHMPSAFIDNCYITAPDNTTVQGTFFYDPNQMAVFWCDYIGNCYMIPNNVLLSLGYSCVPKSVAATNPCKDINPGKTYMEFGELILEPEKEKPEHVADDFDYIARRARELKSRFI